MTAFRAAFKAYRMHQVLILPRFARLTFALGLATAVFPVDAEYYFNPRFLSNDLAESVDLSAFTKGREAPPGTYRVDIYLNDEFMTTGVRVAFNGIEDAENNTLLKLDEGSNTASGLGIEILDGNMRPVKLNDLHAGMQWIPLVPEQNNILPYSARLKSTQKSVNPGLVSASATFTLEFQ